MRFQVRRPLGHITQLSSAESGCGDRARDDECVVAPNGAGVQRQEPALPPLPLFQARLARTGAVPGHVGRVRLALAVLLPEGAVFVGVDAAVDAVGGQARFVCGGLHHGSLAGALATRPTLVRMRTHPARCAVLEALEHGTASVHRCWVPCAVGEERKE